MNRWTRLWTGLALGVTGLLTPLTQTPQVGAAAKVHACHGAQMRVTLGFTKLDLKHNPATWVGWVRYTNEGATCLMSKGDVGVQAVTSKAHVPLGQGSMSDAVARIPFTLHPHASAHALVELVESHKGPVVSCVAVPVTTIEISGYIYGWPVHFFSLKRWSELGVCSGDHIAAVGGVLSPV